MLMVSHNTQRDKSKGTSTFRPKSDGTDAAAVTNITTPLNQDQDHPTPTAPGPGPPDAATVLPPHTGIHPGGQLPQPQDQPSGTLPGTLPTATDTQGSQAKGVNDANDDNSKIGTSHFMSKVKIKSEHNFKSKIKLKSKFKSPLNINSSHNNELKTTLMTRSQPNAAAKAIINTNPNHSPPPDASEAEAAEATQGTLTKGGTS